LSTGPGLSPNQSTPTDGKTHVTQDNYGAWHLCLPATTGSSASPTAAEYLGVTTKTVRNMILDGRLPARTLGVRVVRIRLSDIDAALSPYGGAHVAASPRALGAWRVM
jgi:excisionase family DNA binding protein